MISGATRVAGVIGDPVRHSLSPALHNAAYRELGLDCVYVAFEVREGHAGDAIAAARALGLVGLSVTMPHKHEAALACDELGPDAAALERANTITVEADGRVRGDSTDGEGFVRSLRDAGVDVAGRSVLLLGSGGAARSLALALGRGGARVVVCARRADAAASAAALAHGDARGWTERVAAAAIADVVVNATPIGMDGRRDTGETVVLPAESIRADQVVADLVYHPVDTELLRAARDRGATAVDGIGMLVHQAALQVERWTGHDAPVAAMRAAAHDMLRPTR